MRREARCIVVLAAVAAALSACTDGSSNAGPVHYATASRGPAAAGCDGIHEVVQGTTMVPGDPAWVVVCSENIRARPALTRDTLMSGFGRLITLLNTITPGPNSCNGGGFSTDYTLNFHYPNGAEVTVDINPDCQPGIQNGRVMSNNTDAVVAEINRLLGHR